MTAICSGSVSLWRWSIPHFKGAPTELDFKLYCKAMRDDFRRLARRHPELPLDVLISWVKATTDPAGGIIDSWLGELVSLKLYPEDNLKELQEGLLRARAYLENIWNDAVTIGHYLWSELSERQIKGRLNNYLADHTAVQIWGSKRIKEIIYPQTTRTKPHVQEQRSQDGMEAWNTMNAGEAIVCAELEQIFPEARQLAGYNPDHPLAVAVKNESPKLLPQIAKAFCLIVTISPLVIHHRWTLNNIASCVAISRVHVLSPH